MQRNSVSKPSPSTTTHQNYYSQQHAHQHHQDNNIICRLCFEFEAESSPDYFIASKCGHLYHNSCIRQYLERGRFVCPTCTRPMHSKKLTKLYGIDPNPVALASHGTGGFGPGTDGAALSLLSNSNPNPHTYYDYTFKLVLLGSAGIGKSCLLRRFYDNSFTTTLSYTGGTDLVRKIVQVGDQVIQLIIWDTIGQEKFQSVISTCVRESNGILFVYDITKRESFNSIPFWWKFALDYAPKECVKILVGNKIDLDELRVVEISEGENLAANLSNIPFFETSAKVNDDQSNVEFIFRTLTGQILQNDWIMKAKMLEKYNEEPIKLHDHGSGIGGVNSGDDDETHCFGGFWERIRRLF